MSGFLTESFIKPVAVGVTIALLIGVLSLYNDVQANTQSRVNAEVNDKLLVEMSRSLVRMEQDLKYLRIDVDQVKDSQKNLTSQILEDRNRELRPWEYQSKKE
ncbi:hypothetical protein S140_131 [Shewanella sp. phage 1/40]|uniref:hypothetical protein n=1 Tax=Shewanella phage 1/4 TaxID=1458859 RepID=UPI0004F61F3D|nr:hypothetical protein S14_136 [Shewanella sp. phage 1/4]YP_009104129.1 hypothetical protein S140_131 [Shewanella sp. phage 1/40]AHK11245.1 hypothetical protein S14_136 [Shewanella sp. phage 1/4]AHK11538.1 hypothetical protein S140_131 [Shewanella sp. phage 1/40]